VSIPETIPMNFNTSALIVAHHKVLQSTGGGVQVCNREYMASLEAAGFQLWPVSYDFQNRIFSRLANRIFPKVTKVAEPPGLFQKVHSAVRRTNAEFIFFGMNVFPELSLKLRRIFPDVRQVLLSHGIESIDFCIEQQIRRRTRTENRYRPVAAQMLGRELFDEVEQRRWIDAVLTLSPLDAEVEKWLGSRRILWVPRTIMERRLEAQPVDQRVGCVSTLDHPPNSNGLLQLFDALEGKVSRNFRFRLVGSPTSQGSALAERYAFVEYLGALSDEQLRAEAATWCCFVHPLFDYAKGCSTKLAIGLGWGLPVATTKFGARGYLWDEQVLPLAETPNELTHNVLMCCTRERFKEHQQATNSIVVSAPDLLRVGSQLSDFLRWS
jgi:hypothetical protein